VVLHHNKAAYSEACLTSLLFSSARPLQVINIDNGSSDATPQVIAEFERAAHAAGIAVAGHRFKSNVGAITGRNRALELAEGEYLVFLDNDTLIAQRNWLQLLCDFLESDAGRALVAPKLVFPWQPFLIECCGAAVSARGRVQYLARGEARTAPLQAREVQCAISAAWMTRRAVVDAIGGLDEIYSPVQYEDLDWCYRARAAGYSVWTLPEVELYHFEHTTTSGSDDINFKYVTTRNGIEFKRRWSAQFAGEDGPSEAEAQWQTLMKKSIEEVDWRALLPV
jgi:GT2 family glycosyltransferase